MPKDYVAFPSEFMEHFNLEVAPNIYKRPCSFHGDMARNPLITGSVEFKYYLSRLTKKELLELMGFTQEKIESAIQTQAEIDPVTQKQLLPENSRDLLAGIDDWDTLALDKKLEYAGWMYSGGDNETKWRNLCRHVNSKTADQNAKDYETFINNAGARWLEKTLGMSEDKSKSAISSFNQGYSDAFGNAIDKLSEATPFMLCKPSMLSINWKNTTRKITAEGKLIVSSQPTIIYQDQDVTGLGSIELTYNLERRGEVTGFYLEKAKCTNPIMRDSISGGYLTLSEDRDVRTAFMFYDLIKSGQGGPAAKRIALLKDIATTHNFDKSNDLTPLNLRDADLRGVDLRGADLRGANLTGMIVDDNTRFSKDALTTANFDKRTGFTREINRADGTVIASIQIKDEKLFRESLNNNSVNQAYYDVYKAQVAELLKNETPSAEKRKHVETLLELAERLNVKKVLSGLNLYQADLSELDLSGVNFKKANLEGANFNNAIIDAVTDFRGAKIEGLTLGDPASIRYDFKSLDGKNSVIHTFDGSGYVALVKNAQENPDKKSAKDFERSQVLALQDTLVRKSGIALKPFTIVQTSDASKPQMSLSDMQVLLDTAKLYGIPRDQRLISQLKLADNLTCTVLDPYSGKETSKKTTVGALYEETIHQLVPLVDKNSRKVFAELDETIKSLKNISDTTEKNKFANDKLIKVLLTAHLYPDGVVKQALNNASEKLVQGAPLASVAVEQTPSKQQTLFNAADVNPVIFNSALIKESEGVTLSQYTDTSSNTVDVAQLKGHDQRIIVHPTLFNTQADLTQYFTEIGAGMLAFSPAEKAAAESAAQASVAEQTQAVVITPREPEFAPLEEPLLGSKEHDSFEDVEVDAAENEQNQVIFSAGQEQSKKLAAEKSIHIIPEVGTGVAGQHIRLRVVTQEIGQTFQEAFKNSVVFDPRRAIKPGDVVDANVHTLKVQNLMDDTNCGRYVAAMAIQAAGLAKDGLPITVDTLKASPAVKRALHFSSNEDAQAGLKNTYVRPLAYCKTDEDKMAHYKQVLLCLKSEYESRVKHPDRAFHGEAIFGKYSPAGIFTKLLGYSAKDKLEAVKAIEKVLKHEGDVLNLDRLPAAAKKGMLGDCVKGMIATQERIADEHRKGFSP